MGILIVLGILLFLALVGTLYTVEQQTAAIVQRFGKFTNAANPGLSFKIPLIDQIAGRISLRVQQLDVLVKTETKDAVFVTTNG